MSEATTKTLRNRRDRLAAAFALRHLANTLDGLTLNDVGQITKFDPNEARDKRGQWTTSGYELDAGGESVPDFADRVTRPSHAGLLRRAAVFVKSPQGRKMLLRAAAVAASTVGGHYLDTYAAVTVSDFIENHLGLGYDAASLAALAVGIDGISRKFGLNVHGAKKMLAHAARAASKLVTHIPAQSDLEVAARGGA